MSLRVFLTQFAVGVAASLVTIAIVEVVREREKKLKAAPPVAPGYGTV